MLVATQEPFSVFAANRLSTPYFVFLTQLALLCSVPLLLSSRSSRRDLAMVFSKTNNIVKLFVLFIIGVCGLLLYNIGLSGAHPIITAAILNLSPFWAAMVALVISRKAIPVSPPVFFGCFAVAFTGAMAVAWSQIDKTNEAMFRDLDDNLHQIMWIYAIPIPVFFALSGTLVGKWFSAFDESATIASIFIISSSMLMPITFIFAYKSGDIGATMQHLPAVLLLFIGTIAAASAGRVFYQLALTATNNDNGFVTMFFLLIPAVSSMIAFPLSMWIS